MRMVLTTIVWAAMLAVACGGTGDTRRAPADEPTADAPVVRQSAVSQASNAEGAVQVGVRECDDYLARYTACVEAKVPKEVRAAMMAALEQSKNQWQAAAVTPEGRAGLAESCTRAREAAKASMQAYRCRW